MAAGARIAALAALGCVSAATLPARADGAFPNSQNVMTPAALPHEILLGTNFGLVMSFDDGHSWTWSCEQPLNSFATLYQVGPPPADRLYAVSPQGVIGSDDTGCTWSAAAGVAGPVLDAFADPSDANRVFAIVTEPSDGGVVYQVKASSNGGRSFDAVIYTAAADDHVTGVEAARAAPQTIYLTLTSGSAFTPKVAQSTDGGAHWTVHDLSATLPANTYTIGLIAVDAADPQKLFLRTASTAAEVLAVSTDGGATAALPLTLTGGALTAFARMDSGSLIVAGLVGTDDVVYRSRDAGVSFQKLSSAVPVRGLAARGTTLYAATDTTTASAAIETSPDEGVTWQPLMAYTDIQAIQSCVMAACLGDCLNRADMGQWSDQMCSATAPAPAAGQGGSGATGGAGTGGGPATGGAGTGGGPASGGTGPAPSGGCHCGVGGAAPGWPWLVLLGLALARRRRNRGN